MISNERILLRVAKQAAERKGIRTDLQPSGKLPPGSQVPQQPDDETDQYSRWPNDVSSCYVTG